MEKKWIKAIMLIAFSSLLLVSVAFAFSNASCVDDSTLRTIYNYSWTVNDTVYNVTRTSDQFCELGCVGNVCRNSVLRQNEPLAFIGLLVAGLGCAYWAYTKHWWNI